MVLVCNRLSYSMADNLEPKYREQRMYCMAERRWCQALEPPPLLLLLVCLRGTTKGK